MKTYFPTTFKLHFYESIGELKVVDRLEGLPLPMSYVKVYRKKGNSTSFFKDGYTDLRGRFNYAELSGSGDATQIEKFSIFVQTESNESLIKEATNPRNGSAK